MDLVVLGWDGQLAFQSLATMVVLGLCQCRDIPLQKFEPCVSHQREYYLIWQTLSETKVRSWIHGRTATAALYRASCPLP